MSGDRDDAQAKHDFLYDPDADREPCPTCKGRYTVNPLTAPAHFFCVGTTTCPDCDGSGSFDW